MIDHILLMIGNIPQMIAITEGDATGPYPGAFPLDPEGTQGEVIHAVPHGGNGGVEEVILVVYLPGAPPSGATLEASLHILRVLEEGIPAASLVVLGEQLKEQKKQSQATVILQGAGMEARVHWHLQDLSRDL